jgi:hypothetical protein
MATTRSSAHAPQELPSPQEILYGGNVSQSRNPSSRKFIAFPACFDSIEVNVPRAFDLCKRPKTMMAGCGADFTELLIAIAPLENDKRRHEVAPLSVR